MIVLRSFDDAREGFRSRALRQALYDDGHRLMNGVIVNLHGDEHIARRRLENRLFRRDTFAWYEQQHIPAIIDAVLGPAVRAGHGELLEMARHTMMTLSVDVAGVDLPRKTADSTELDGDAFALIYDIMNRLAKASTVAHAIGDTEAMVAAGDEALATFDRDFFQPSLARRAQLVAQHAAGTLDEDALPRDVLTTLLRNQDRLALPDEVVLREIAYYPWVGSHSTSAQLVHAMHHMFVWLDERPADRNRLVEDDAWRQRFVHESMRLHPASPVALRIATEEIALKSGTVLGDGETVSISVQDANRDPAVFGDRPDEFDPDRVPADGVPLWGLSFGHGTHACLGQELAGGLEADDELQHHLLGSVALMAGAMLRHGARPNPDDTATLDSHTSRVMWGRYPVVFDQTLRHNT